MASLNLIDTRALGKPPAYTGLEAGWAAWCFQFEAFASLLHEDLADHMEQAAQLPLEPALQDFNEEVRNLSKILYALLVTLCRGKAVNLLMHTEKHNGLAGWRRMKREYEPDLPGRHANMLAGVIAPDWSSLTTHTFK